MVNLQDKSIKYYPTVSDSQAFVKNPVSSAAEIWECPETGAKSLHALTQFLPGDIIAKLGARKYVTQPNYLSVQVSDEQHIMLAPEFLQYINHSCDPNVFFDTTNMVVVCLRKIEIGDAMSFFYPSTEWSMTQRFDCLCGSEKCLGKIQGAAHLTPEILQNYQLSNHIKAEIT